MSLPIGTILLWFGSVASIPIGFHLCDGTAGTPDLRNRFVVGAGQAFNPGDSGGSNTHVHTVTTFAHNHSIVAGSDLHEDVGFNLVTANSAPGGSADEQNHLPPYHALAYIMRI